MSNNKPIISIVEEIKDHQLDDIMAKVYDIDFWYKIVPLKNKQIEIIKDKEEYSYEVADTIQMDPTGTLTHDLKSHGKIYVDDKGETPGKGRLWELKVDVEHPLSFIEGNVRARNIDSSTIKVGIFIYKVDFDLGNLKDLPFGRDAILFAGRIKLRETVKIFMESL